MGKFFTKKVSVLLILAAMLTSLCTKAQVSAYAFSQTSATYSAITSPDSLGTSSSDDQRYVDPAVPQGGTATTGVGFPIGFNFVFNADTFDRIAINTNGWISFGKSSLTPSVNNASTSAYTPLASTATITPSILRNRIAAVGRDLQAQPGASIRYKVLGASPNQIYVLQWENFKRFGTTGTGDTLNFQIRLYETTNVVEVVFGTMKFGTGTSTGTAAPHVGLGGSVSTDYNNRTTTTDWNATTAGGANNVGCAVNTGVIYPVSGTVFRWTPPVACSGTPVAGTTVSTANPVCPATNFTLSLSGATTGATGITYQWISSADGLNYSLIPGATSATRTDTTTQERYYRCIVTCTNSGLSDTSTVLYVTLNVPTQCYCTPTYTSGCGSGDAITNVVLGTLSNSSACTPSPYYTFYNNVTVPNLQQTVQQTISISFGTDANQYAGVWIDYNQDGDFDDAGEFVAYNTVSAGASGTTNLSFTVPLTATLGQTRMRIRGGNDSQLSNTPCGASSSGFGETEDYLVNITAAPACVPATSITVNSVTGTSATVNWTSGTGSTSSLEYGPTGFTPGTGTIIANATSPYTINGLSPQTAYQVYITDTCTGGVIAPSAGPVAFTTQCSPFPYPGDTYNSAVVVNTYPFTDTVNTAGSCYTDASPLRLGKDLFYKVVADSCATSITFSLCGSSFDTYLYIRDSANTTTLYSNDDFCSLQSQITFTPTAGTTYYAVVEPFSSTGTGTVVVNVTQTTGSPVLSHSFVSPSCAGVADGSASVAITAFGSQPVTYAWSNGGTTATISNISSGTYYVTVTSACGSATDSVVVPATFNASLTSVTNVTCNGGNNGAVNVTVANGTQPYTFLWSNGATSEDISGLTAGTYCLTVTENGGCSATICATVTEPIAINIAGVVTDALCNGGSSGAINITATGGTAATYSQAATVTGANLLQTSTITLTGAPVASSAGTLVLSAYGDIDGTGTNQEDWVFYDENGNQLASVGATGNFSDQCATTVTVTLSVTPTQIAAWTADGTVTFTATANSNVNLTLCGGDFISAQLSYAASYGYAWSTGATTEDVTGLAAGSHTVTVTDNANCTATASFTVGQPAPIVPSLDSLNQVSCFGGSNGGVYISVAGGTAPYSFSWSNGSTNEDLTGVAAGIYTGTITDAHGCTFASPQIPITEPTDISIIIDSATNITCNGADNGAVYVTVAGGTPGYTYLWSNSAVTEDINGLEAGSYTLTVTDNNGCTAEGSAATISEPAMLTLALDSTTDNPCHGNSHGNVYVTAGGGTLPYSFNWSNGATTEDLTQVPANTYTVTLTDANGCTAVPVTATVNEPSLLTAVVDSSKNVSCNGGSDGAVYVTVDGGTPGYTYVWSNGPTTEDITGLSANTYELTATDANGCTVAVSQAITEPTPLNPTVDSIVAVKCYGGNTGGIYISVTGGTSPYSYSWSNGSTNQDLVGVPAGNYTGTLTDANGCTSSSPSLTVTQPASALSATSVSSNQIQGGVQGSVNLSVSGGTLPYSFNWSNGATTEDLSSVPAGIYTCTITDANGCTITQKDTVDLVIGIENVVAAYSVNLYPNPTQNNVTVNVNLPAASDVTVEVYTVEGKLIRKMEEKQTDSAKFFVSFLDEAEGVYFARITVDGNVSTHRIVVTK
jgi:hypothetical protein